MQGIATTGETCCESRFFSRLFFFPLIFVFFIFFASCGEDRSNSDTDSAVGAGSITGTAFKGPVQFATITAYIINTDGSRGAKLAVTTSDAEGRFTFGVSFTVPVLVIATGGSYIDEATGATVDMTSKELRAMAPDGVADGEDIALTPLTHAAAAEAEKRMKAGEGPESAITNSNKEIAEIFGLGGVDILHTRPADMTQNVDQNSQSGDSINYGAVIAGLSQQNANDGNAPDELLDRVEMIGEDLVDGNIDDPDNQSIINKIPYVIDEFLESDQNDSGVQIGQVNVTPGDITFKPDSDRDGDGIPDNIDNCVATDNGNQADSDGDGIGDACDGSNDSSRPVNGTCGAAATDYAANETGFSGEYCSHGRANPSAPVFPTYGETTTWECNGIDGGASVTCTATRALEPIVGSCGTANGKTYLAGDSSYGSDTFCISGTSNPLSPAFPNYSSTTNWSCDGANGGTNVSCSSSRAAAVVDATCTVPLPSFVNRTSSSLNLTAGSVTDTDGVQNVTVELFSDSGASGSLGTNVAGDFSGLSNSTDYWARTNADCKNGANSQWEAKTSSMKRRLKEQAIGYNLIIDYML